MRALLWITLLLASVGAPRGVDAAPAAERDYSIWEGRFERAPSEAARRELAASAPAMARIWFYGYVFDLATPGIPDAEKARIRAAGGVVAEVLGALDEIEPQLLLDRADEGALAPIAVRVRAAAEAVIVAGRSAASPEAPIIESGDSLVAEAVTYVLVQRAYVARGALGGSTEAAQIADGARAAALTWLGLSGDARAWRTVTACSALPGLDPPLPRLRLRAAADALSRGDARVAWDEAEAARRLAIGRGEAPLSLVALGVQAVADAEAQPARARVELMSLEGALRQGGALWAAERVVTRRLGPLADDPPSLARTAARLAEAEAGQQDHQIVGALATVALRLRAAGRARADAGDPEAALPLLDIAGALLERLADSAVLTATTPGALRAAVAAERARARAEVELARAALAERTGRLDEAIASARRAVEAMPPADRGEAHAMVGRLALALGRFDEADAATAAAEGSATLPVEAQVDNRLVRARLRLAQRRWAAAFAHANRGLRRLRAAGLADVRRAERAALHHVAALALDGDGQREAAIERLVFAHGVQPRAEAALDLAALRLEQGDRAGAEAAFVGVDAPAARATRGCLLAARGEVTGASAVLAGLDGPAGQVALMCRAALMWPRDRAAARRLVDAAGLGPASDPRLVWVGAVIRADFAGAAAAWRAARGYAAVRVDRRRALAPIDIAGLVTGAAVDAASPAGLAGSVWWRQAADAPRSTPPTWPEGLLALAAEVEGRAAAAARPTAEAVALTRLADARARWVAALDALDEAAPRWAAVARPRLPEGLAPTAGLRLYLQTSAERSRGWVWRPDEKPVEWALPGRAELERWVAPLHNALRTATPWPANATEPADPHADQWRALARLAADLLPPLADEPPAGALEIWADGPLAGLPLEAVVVDAPRQLGLAPRFLAQGRVVVHRLGAGPLPPSSAGLVGLVELSDPVEAALEGLDARAFRALLGETGGGEPAVSWVGHGALPEAEVPAVVVAGAGPDGAVLRARGMARLIRGVGEVPPEVAARLLATLAGRPPRPALRLSPPSGGQAAALEPAVVVGTGAPVDVDAALARVRAAAFAAPVRGGEVPAHHPSRWAPLIGVAP